MGETTVPGPPASWNLDFLEKNEIKSVLFGYNPILTRNRGNMCINHSSRHFNFSTHGSVVDKNVLEPQVQTDLNTCLEMHSVIGATSSMKIDVLMKSKCVLFGYRKTEIMLVFMLFQKIIGKTSYISIRQI